MSTRPVRFPWRALLWVALAAAVALARPAAAAVPDPAHCYVQNVIVGSWSGNPVPTSASPCSPKHPGLFYVIVHDALNLPIAGATVKLFFAGSGVRVYTAQDAGTVVLCPGQELGATTDASGIATFSPRLAGYNEGPSVQVTANGIVLGSVPAISPDYDGDGRVTLIDLNTMAGDYLNPLLVRLRSDFDNCPSSQLADLTYMTSEYLASSGQPASAVCP